jgi:nitroimidazol reductase NimA-like FMN-containing flavoprotein (pyridoxamine 5'-phosphate oxidase superfamily)
MLSVVMNVLLNNNFCVLSTCRNDMPNSSLMQYICGAGCTKLYMLTLKDSTKYTNIMKNPNVSLLVDTRDNASQVYAVTIYGNARIISKEDSKKLFDQFRIRYTNLQSLAANHDACIIEITPKSFLFLESADKSHFINLTET